MSRIGNKLIIIPDGVKVSINGNILKAEGPKGSQELVIPNYLKVELTDDTALIKKLDEEKLTQKMHGSFRALANNLIQGVFKPFEKVLEIQGVGYRAAMEGVKLVLQMGFSHNVEFDIPKGITCQVEKNTIITISGCNKEQVGEFAAVVRKVRKPEPYKGKGIRYQGEHVRRKAGKTAK